VALGNLDLGIDAIRSAAPTKSTRRFGPHCSRISRTFRGHRAAAAEYLRSIQDRPFGAAGAWRALT